MRQLLTIGMLLGLVSSAAAQHAPDSSIAGSKRCWPVTTRDEVVVVTDAGAPRTGTLLCMGPDEIVLAGSGALPLSSIQRISKPRDGTIDGVLKGAAVGLVIFALCGGECDAEYLLRGTLAYAAIGGTIDALQGNDKTIYRRPALTWTVKF
jgi:hypothetical protein